MDENRPILVGVTGGIGSGKSTVCKVFEMLGTPVYYADDRAKKITNIDPELKEQIIQRFGEESYIGNTLNRTYLAQKVFADKAALNALNALIHPRVALDFDKWISANKHHPYLLKEAALIFETKGNLKLDKVITITADENVRIKRVLTRDNHRTEQDIKNIISKQMPEVDKIRPSDVVINNNGDQLIIPQILEFHQNMLKISKSQEA